MVILVDIDSSNLEVLRNAADVNLIHLIVAANNNILDDKWCTCWITCFVETNIDFLKSQSIFAS